MNTKGLTLTELLISVTIIGIIMLGIMAVDLALRQGHESVAKDTQANMNLMAITLDLTNNILGATGQQGNPGVVILPATGGGEDWELFIRHDVSDPFDYGDDIWIRYRNGPSPDPVLYKCSDTDVSGGFPLATCNVGERNMGSLRYLDPNAGDPDQYIFTPNETTHELFVEIHLESLYNNTLAENPITNPSGGVIDTRVLPLGHTW